MVAFDFASIRVEGEHRRGIEIVPRVHIPWPGRGIPRPPGGQVTRWSIVAGDPYRHPPSLPGLTRPGVVARLARTWDGIGLPYLLARLRIIGRNEAANAQLATGGTHHDLALGNQRRQGQI